MGQKRKQQVAAAATGEVVMAPVEVEMGRAATAIVVVEKGTVRAEMEARAEGASSEADMTRTQ